MTKVNEITHKHLKKSKKEIGKTAVGIELIINFAICK
jgi:hypothetical protein